MQPTLTWFVNQSPVHNTSYIGSYESTDTFEITVEAINNYLGLDPCDEIKNGRLLLMFKDYEDSILLNHLQVQFDGSYYAPLEVIGNRAYAKIPRVLSGDYSTPKDCTLTIKISMNQDLAVKGDLKQLILDIVY